jgi:hypothetical protein
LSIELCVSLIVAIAKSRQKHFIVCVISLHILINIFFRKRLSVFFIFFCKNNIFLQIILFLKQYNHLRHLSKIIFFHF